MPTVPAPTSASTPTPTPPVAPVRWHWGSALAGALISAILCGGVTLAWRQPDPPPITIYAPPTTLPPTVMPSPTPSPLVIFISGAVQAPGVYELPPGARVVDALARAGGFSADANVNTTNQAAPLRDGDQIYVPTAVEEPATPVTGITNDAPAAAADSTSAAGTSGPVNVNTATLEELETLPGIGPSRAQDIINNRPYATVDELDRVPGIGSATLEKLRPYVVVQ
jgi:competence protein ComEA